jgi:hypothetical protein
MKTLARFGEFEVVTLDSPRHRHRGIHRFAVRDSKQNYSGYSRSEQEAEVKAKALDEQDRKDQDHGKALAR